MYLTNAGKHSKLGELIGRAVKPAVKEALFKQTGVGYEQQHNAVRRLERFGVSEVGIFQRYREEKKELDRPSFSALLEEIERKSEIVAGASFLAHAIDQMDWGLFKVKETMEAASRVLQGMGRKEPLPGEKVYTEDEAVSAVMEGFETLMTKLVEEAYRAQHEGE